MPDLEQLFTPLDADGIPDIVADLISEAETDAKAWCKACHELLSSPAGRKWIKMAMVRYNLMGSVFADGLDPIRAAHVDGRRHVLSDMLNSAHTYKPTSEDTD